MTRRRLEGHDGPLLPARCRRWALRDQTRRFTELGLGRDGSLRLKTGLAPVLGWIIHGAGLFRNQREGHLLFLSPPLALSFKVPILPISTFLVPSR
jgi:hypothetical protein